jgi:allophanate hydrolase subunit 1
LGRTPAKLFDQTNQNNPSLLSPGDTVNFYKITKSNFFNFDNRELYH